ncbi:hypothetical protein DM02DRAFT_647720 [Periconia macrospinosa]|uniref:Uncharacterized protein n=1 Tax=Periconia macrospinosa TaxID=97972 RepID=A0A2V1EDZ2_9PLEO|nr:hypothetical protein DM02DRAFT_647720 [Periconia macrospinosa]
MKPDLTQDDPTINQEDFTTIRNLKSALQRCTQEEDAASTAEDDLVRKMRRLAQSVREGRLHETSDFLNAFKKRKATDSSASSYLKRHRLMGDGLSVLYDQSEDDEEDEEDEEDEKDEEDEEHIPCNIALGGSSYSSSRVTSIGIASRGFKSAAGEGVFHAFFERPRTRTLATPSSSFTFRHDRQLPSLTQSSQPSIGEGTDELRGTQSQVQGYEASRPQSDRGSERLSLTHASGTPSRERQDLPSPHADETAPRPQIGDDELEPALPDTGATEITINKTQQTRPESGSCFRSIGREPVAGSTVNEMPPTQSTVEAAVSLSTQSRNGAASNGPRTEQTTQSPTSSASNAPEAAQQPQSQNGPVSNGPQTVQTIQISSASNALETVQHSQTQSQATTAPPSVVPGFFFYDPSTDSRRPFTDLPNAVSSRLRDAFERECGKNVSTIEKYRTMIKPQNQRKHFNVQKCIRTYTAVRRPDPPSIQQGLRACSACIKSKMPCVVLRKHDTHNTGIFVLLPLPQSALPAGATWQDVSYWLST